MDKVRVKVRDKDRVRVLTKTIEKEYTRIRI
jgi:hypothetical protein